MAGAAARTGTGAGTARGAGASSATFTPVWLCGNTLSTVAATRWKSEGELATVTGAAAGSAAAGNGSGAIDTVTALGDAWSAEAC